MKSNAVLVEKALKKGSTVVTEAWIQHLLKHGNAPVNPPDGCVVRPSGASRSSTDVVPALSSSSSRAHASKTSLPVPILSLILPQSGPHTGNFKVSIFGHRLVNGPSFRIRIGHLDAVDYEFHGESCVVATIPEIETPFAPGEILAGVSNDGGANWCNPLVFSIYDPTKSNAPLPPPAVLNSILSAKLVEAASKGALSVDIGDSIGSEGGAIGEMASTTGEVVPSAKPLMKTLDREIRVFISSPFTDMQDERDVLVKQVIPKLRRMCMQRDVVFSYVDLRWGVTAHQSESAASLLLCLREIESCNLFVGFYGERYGWCVSPERDPNQNDLLRRSITAAQKEFPWVSDMSSLSVSEIEMRMVLDRKYDGSHGDKHSWFYLRDPYYIEEVPEKDKHLYKCESDRAQVSLDSFKKYLSSSARPKNYARPCDISELVMADITEHIDREYPEKTRLSPLNRERFRHSVYARSFAFCYLPNEIYFNQLDRYVHDSLTKPLVVVGGSGMGKSALLSNWVARHEQHAPEDIVIQHCVGCSPISSNAGQLLCRILLELREKLEFHDDKILPREDPQGHASGSYRSSSSSSYDDYNASSGDSQGLGLDPKKVMKEFLNSIRTIVTKYNYNKRRIILVIDGLDKLDERENAQDLIWLPLTFPKSVRVILSATSSSFVTSVLKKRKGTDFLELQPMGEADRKHFIRTYLTLRSKRLTEAQEFKIAQAAPTAHPLYLKTLLDDLNEFGKFDQLDAKIAHNLSATTPAALYDVVLQRLEDEFDTSKQRNEDGADGKSSWSLSDSEDGSEFRPSRRRGGSKAPLLGNVTAGAIAKGTVAATAVARTATVTSSFLTLLWASRRGLLLNGELDQILTRKNGFSEERCLDFFVVADETLLADCSGLLLFKNADVRAAVEKRYLPTEAARIAAHTELATWFETEVPDLTERKIEELPHHYAESKQFDKLRTFLKDLTVFDRLYTSEAHKFDLLRYWRLLEAHGSAHAIPSAPPAPRVIPIAPPPPSSSAVWSSGTPTNLTNVVHRPAAPMAAMPNEYDPSENYKTVVSRGSLPNGLLVGDLMYHLGRFLLEMDKNEGAEFFFQKAEAYYHHASQLLNVAKVLAALGELHFTQVRHDDCERVLLKAVEIYEKEKGPQSQSMVHPLDRLGVLYTAQRKVEKAKAVLTRALRISEANEGADAISTANVVYDLACAYLTSEEPDAVQKAEENLLRALKTKEAALGPWDIEVSHVLLRLGAMYMEQSQFGDAEECLERSLTIRETKLGKEHSRVAQCLRHFITCYEMQEQYAPALAAGERALAITKKVYGEENFHVSGVLLRLATVLLTQAKADATHRAKQMVTDALRMRKAVFAPGHRCIAECEKVLTSIDALLAPPPPPPPSKSLLGGILTGGRLPEPTSYAQGATKPLVSLDANGVPLGAPPPPPPPSKVSAGLAPPQQMPKQAAVYGQMPPQPQMAPRQVQQLVQEGMQEANYIQQLQNFSAGLLNRNAYVADRSDANKQAQAMLGVNARKIQFKKPLALDE